MLGLPHWGRMTHICVSKLTIIGSDNGLAPGRRQAIFWTNARIFLIRTLGTNVSEIFSEIHIFSVTKMHLKVSSAKWRLFRLGLNVLKFNHVSKWGYRNIIQTFVVRTAFYSCRWIVISCMGWHGTSWVKVSWSYNFSQTSVLVELGNDAQSGWQGPLLLTEIS